MSTNNNTKRIVIATVIAFALGAVVVIGIRGSMRQQPPSDDPHAEHPTGHDSVDNNDNEHGDGEGHAHHGVNAAHKDNDSLATLYVCASDPSIGLSWAGTCPLDGTTLVERRVDTTQLKDLGNKKCPIMGGDAKDDVFAVYKGNIVRFCCKGCEKSFFETPDEHIETLRETVEEPVAPEGSRNSGDGGAEHPAHGHAESRTLYVCASDPSIGLSWAGNCPLDGSTMVERSVNAKQLKDLANEKCPIMGGDAKEDVFAVYKGQIVRFCCKGCDKSFFEKPDEHLQALARGPK